MTQPDLAYEECFDEKVHELHSYIRNQSITPENYCKLATELRLKLDLLDSYKKEKKDFGADLDTVEEQELKDFTIGMNLLPFIKHDLNLIYGEGGLGKSTVANYIAISNAIKGRKVFLFNAEDRPSQVKYRISKIIDLKMIRGMIKISNETFQILNKEKKPTYEYFQLKKYLEDEKFDVLIIDPLILFSGGLDENSTSDMRPLLKALNDIRGCTKIILHHSNKQGIMRGASAIRDAVRLAYQLNKGDVTNNYLTFNKDNYGIKEDYMFKGNIQISALKTLLEKRVEYFVSKQTTLTGESQW